MGECEGGTLRTSAVLIILLHRERGVPTHRAKMHGDPAQCRLKKCCRGRAEC